MREEYGVLLEVEQSKRRRETTAHGMQRFCDEIEIEIETAHPAADDDDISEEIVEEKQKQEKSQEE